MEASLSSSLNFTTSREEIKFREKSIKQKMIFRPHKCPPASTGEKFFIHVDVENAKKHTKECLFEDTIDCGLFFSASSANTSGRDVIMTLEVATFSQLQTKRLESTLRSIMTRNTCSNSCEETENVFFLYSQRGGKSAFPFFVFLTFIFPTFIFPDKYCAFEAHVGQQTAEHGFNFHNEIVSLTYDLRGYKTARCAWACTSDRL